MLDSGSVEELRQKLSEHSIEYKILKDHGCASPTKLDFVKEMLKNSKCTVLTAEEYKLKVDRKEYPPTSFLRAGDMIVFESNISREDLKKQIKQATAINLIIGNNFTYKSNIL